MAYTQLLYHIVFRTRNSQRTISEKNEAYLYRYIWGIIKGKECVLHRIGGMPDHIHILVQLPPTITLADFVRDVKKDSSKYAKSHRELFPYFEGWAASFFAATHTYANKDVVINYIRNQKEHHKKLCFQDEVALVFKENDLSGDISHFFAEK